MPTFHVEGTAREWPEDLRAATDEVAMVLRRYRWTPFLLLGKMNREGMALQCASAALVAAGHDPFSADD